MYVHPRVSNTGAHQCYMFVSHTYFGKHMHDKHQVPSNKYQSR